MRIYRRIREKIKKIQEIKTKSVNNLNQTNHSLVLFKADERSSFLEDMLVVALSLCLRSTMEAIEEYLSGSTLLHHVLDSNKANQSRNLRWFFTRRSTVVSFSSISCFFLLFFKLPITKLLFNNNNIVESRDWVQALISLVNSNWFIQIKPTKQTP